MPAHAVRHDAIPSRTTPHLIRAASVAFNFIQLYRSKDIKCLSTFPSLVPRPGMWPTTKGLCQCRAVYDVQYSGPLQKPCNSQRPPQKNAQESPAERARGSCPSCGTHYLHHRAWAAINPSLPTASSSCGFQDTAFKVAMERLGVFCLRL